MSSSPETSDQTGGVNIIGLIGPIGGDLVGRDKITYGLSAEELVAVLEARGFLQTADTVGLQRRTIITLANRLKPNERLNLDQAITELERAVEVFLDVTARGERGTSDDAFVNVVLAQVAERIRSDDLDGGASAIDAAFAELEAKHRRSQVALLEEGVKVDSLCRDAASVARRIETIVNLCHPGERSKWRSEFRNRYNTFYEEGKEKGINFSLSVAIELARRMVANSQDGAERGSATALLGRALRHLGKREAGTERLEQALVAFHEALEDQRRELVPLRWAATQNRIGLTLRRLGEREVGTKRLEQAVNVFQEALLERKRDIVPFDWAQTQNNLGAALVELGKREPGTERLHLAVTAFENALQEFKEDIMPQEWAMAHRNLSSTLALIAEKRTPVADVLSAVLVPSTRKLSTRKEELEQAVIAHLKVLEKQTRELVPLDWAATQNNIGILLSALGKGEPGTGWLEEAVAAYRAALEEYTRERVPLDWAQTQYNLGLALLRLGERESGTARLEEAVAAWEACLTVTASVWPAEWVLSVRTCIGETQAEIARRAET
jgi:tetratricopeptide (TPR) repeat protein